MKFPDDMRAQERIDEIATILAEGVVRLKQKKTRKSKRFRDVLLDSSPDQSVHATKQGESA